MKEIFSFLTAAFASFITSLGFIGSPTPTSSTLPITKLPEVTIESIFDQGQNPSLKGLDQSKLVTILATGDVVPGRSVNYQATKFNDFTWSWKNVADFTRNADLTYVNFEVPLVPNCPVTNEGMVFCGNEKHLEGLISGGVDVANIANNHAGDWNKVGINNTQKVLSEAGIAVTGIGKIVYKTVKGVRYAFLGYNDITSVVNPSPADPQKIISDLKAARLNADVVIVGFHWGVEYTAQLTNRQRTLAHLAIDNGADLILGNHPHWIQPVEIYKGKVITYAHGNFIFDQMWSEKTEEGVVGKYIFYGNQLVDVKFFPIKIKDYGQPYFLEGEKGDQILESMKQESELLGI